ncbi:MAG: FAD-containing monooxygenase EthA [Oceanospirillaceae bacterium]|uniref:flavin-containing monooxygenase n=1 Tax=unclassified Thalassolituus TaxID=2624967 RepID=UPI000C092B70|nr:MULTISPECIES: NAD(P)/FAD-dependent oxidoreductase [unclassified Thalassolituus]MAK90010.1 FAD-containing monooxygenase EthA [Thalassolituus sp.]MAS25632.1 FAD-containing monooxygenase EthA [Oceanospirillaceae bacterium]MAX98784.1 FAD-containing monooxygenase EthA [Oceanospirillaceae bacterium]MBL35692.1 FAD-containing monooxygenase EthA [Oceanospirillaceae bacterium]MBS52221.1 FAD-containing monooxygenase EthA [Oceanospirillaceae bacterium]|tara:strand:- start:5811 stop:7334 length:1524 start_codon:yes stop_codon:yes gene_type:complete
MANEYFDVIIIGAGLSGIGAACHLSKECPEKSFAIFEGRDAIGGTWDIFRYPGIRSDSDMFTLGYEFKPWTNRKGIADGADIRDYIREAANEHSITPHIRFGHKILSAEWQSDLAVWQITAQLNDGETRLFSCNYLISCTGYYSYEEGFTPEFKGREQFSGEIIHPQFWPENYDYSGKKIVVIGSGATAVTLVPALCDKAQQVTMLQRSPSYVVSVPQQDPMVSALRKILPQTWAYRIIRGRNISITLALYNFCKKFPRAARGLLQFAVKSRLPKDFDMKHFTPKYAPWDERLCAVPEGDMFRAMSSGKAQVVTDHIDHFTADGIRLKSGKTLAADVIITATGLKVQMFGNMTVKVDGDVFVPNQSMSYRGVMFENLPNLAMVFGYTNSSWTLKADLISRWVCRLLKAMDKKGARQVTPRCNSAEMERLPFINMQSGYIARVKDQIPKQGSERPWKLYQNYFADMAQLRLASMNDPALEYRSPNQHGYKNPAGSDSREESSAVMPNS